MDKAGQATELVEKGYSHLDEGCFVEALRIGRRLQKLRHSSGFEILARAYRQSDRLPQAVRVLEDGVAKAGRVWILWSLLGNCYSDSGQFAKAEKAYQQALLRPQCDSGVVHLNRAIAFARARKFLKAATAIHCVRSQHLLRRAEACRIRISLAQAETRMARQLAFRLCQRRANATENYSAETESEILLACALAFKDSRSAKQKALRLALKAVEIQPNNQEALATVREILQQKASNPCFFRLTIQGIWHTRFDDSHVPPGFFRAIEVVADDRAAAFQYSKPFFPKAVRKSLLIDKANILSGPAVSLEGVYFVSGYMFYPRRKQAKPPR
jgi:tetratricopeptide (TPR) repeat protein